MPTYAKKAYSLPLERVQPLLDAIGASGQKAWESKRCAAFLATHPKNLATRLRTACESELLHRIHHGRGWWYALGPAPAPVDPGQQTGDKPPPGYEPTDDEGSTQDIGDFSASLWTDGELMLIGVETNKFGQLVLRPPQVRQLRSLLIGGIA